jgi:hypothetical protein
MTGDSGSTVEQGSGFVVQCAMWAYMRMTMVSPSFEVANCQLETGAGAGGGSDIKRNYNRVLDLRH